MTLPCILVTRQQHILSFLCVGNDIYFPKRELGQKNYDDMSVIYGDKRPSYCTVKNRVARFRIGHLSTEDEERSGRPTQATIQENFDAVHSMILDD
jgi:hypothetical protein